MLSVTIPGLYISCNYSIPAWLYNLHSSDQYLVYNILLYFFNHAVYLKAAGKVPILHTTRH